MKQIILLCLLAMLAGCAGQHPTTEQSIAAACRSVIDSSTNTATLAPGGFITNATNAMFLGGSAHPATANHVVRNLMISLGVFFAAMLVLIWRLECAPVIEERAKLPIPEPPAPVGDPLALTEFEQAKERVLKVIDGFSPPALNEHEQKAAEIAKQELARLSQSATARKRRNRKTKKK
jgi:hypothetical protein